MKEQAHKKSFLRELLESLAIAVIIVVLVNLFIVQLFVIPSPSMEPTLLVDDRVVVAKYAYYFSQPQRGDIVVFRYPEDTRVHFIKRVIGLPGESVSVRGNKVYINGNLLRESYLGEKTYPDFGPVLVPPENYFVMGDNRDQSADSRVWGFLPKKLLTGEAQWRYWPLARMGKVE